MGTIKTRHLKISRLLIAIFCLAATVFVSSLAGCAGEPQGEQALKTIPLEHIEVISVRYSDNRQAVTSFDDFVSKKLLQHMLNTLESCGAEPADTRLAAAIHVQLNPDSGFNELFISGRSNLFRASAGQGELYCIADPDSYQLLLHNFQSDKMGRT